MYSPERFEKLVAEFLEREEKILAWKRGEYSTSADRLQNFREVAGFMGVYMPEIALYYLLKHIQSIKNAVLSEKRYNWTWETPEGEGLKQRIADSRNYLLLLAACLDEKNEEIGAGKEANINERLSEIPIEKYICGCGWGGKEEGEGLKQRIIDEIAGGEEWSEP